MTDHHDRIGELFVGRPRTQTVTTTARGRTALGEFQITIEQSLPDNVEPQPTGAIEQTELAFHAAFGTKATHLDADGEPNPDLSESIQVEVEGDYDAEAAEATADAMANIIAEALQGRREDSLQKLLENTIRPDDGPTLN